MDAYRSGLCTFCNDTATALCPRCEVVVCATHGLAPDAYCAMCRKERDEEAEIRRFAELVHEDAAQPGVTLQTRALESIIVDVARAVHEFFSPSRPSTSFARRTPAEIAEWRRSAGIKLRAQRGR